jgi:hypothetical protein
VGSPKAFATTPCETSCITTENIKIAIRKINSILFVELFYHNLAKERRCGTLFLVWHKNAHSVKKVGMLPGDS